MKTDRYVKSLIFRNCFLFGGDEVLYVPPKKTISTIYYYNKF